MMSAPSLKALSLHFSPLIDMDQLIGMAIVLVLLLMLAAWQRRTVPWLRMLVFAAFLFVLSGPALNEQKREPVKNIAVVVMDESASQQFKDRNAVSAQILDEIKAAYGASSAIELRVINGPEGGALASQTDLFQELDAAFADVPASRRAGVIFISDGQIHDVPDMLGEDYGPIHLILSGRRDEKDRRISIADAPAFGIVGQRVKIKFRIDDNGLGAQADARVTIKKAGSAPEIMFIKPGEDTEISLPVDHAGQNVFELSTEEFPGEITTVNNRVALDLQGVRDRLRVLLVSGRPHAGGRTWRDLLTSDPSVDLVHFTILRDPEKIDGTPPSEMSLIAFPFKELFEVKLYEFDLIIFDRYTINHILPDFYFDNIARYVREGGAFLEASGPDFAGDDSIYNTALRDILPGAPSGQVLNDAFTPAITDKGKTHPVTRSLSNAGSWGPWLRQVVVTPRADTDVLMRGEHNDPLLLLRRAGDGRVAQIASDEIWLWARGYQGGGPHAELLRRVVHWLMKEPELDELALDVSVNGSQLVVRRPAYQRQDEEIEIRKPDGEVSTLALKDNDEGFLEARLQADQLGIYEFSGADGQSRFAIVGDVDPPEFRDVLASETKLAPIIEQSGGGAFWAAQDGMPRLSIAGPNGRTAGNQWLALRDNRSYSVVGTQERPIAPLEISLLILLGLGIFTWWAEGRTKN